MIEREVGFEHEGLRFAGTLALPEGEGPFPAALMIGGSGPNDRDTNSKRFRAEIASQLATSLAGIGVASLRYDKRGVGGSEGDFWSAGFHQTRADAAAALQALAAQDDVRKDALYILGHSEGAMHAARLAAEGASVAGAVLLSGIAGSLEACLLWQGRAVVEALTGFPAWLVRVLRIDLLAQQRKALAKVRASKKDVTRVQLIAKQNTRWLREALDYDCSDDIARLRVPTLAVTGAADIQTPPHDLERMRELNPDYIETALIPKMSHLLRLTEGGGLQDYRRQLKQPLAPELLQTLRRFFEARRAEIDSSGAPFQVPSCQDLR